MHYKTVNTDDRNGQQTHTKREVGLHCEDTDVLGTGGISGGAHRREDVDQINGRSRQIGVGLISHRKMRMYEATRRLNIEIIRFCKRLDAPVPYQP
jgi:hypothetical protein